MSKPGTNYPEDPSSPGARGKRLKTLRKLTDLTREAIAKRYAISASTLRSWEDGKATGLTEQGARRIIDAFKREGIQCNIGWLMYGKGNQPFFKIGVTEPSPTITVIDDDKDITNELNYFIQHHPHAAYFVVQDDAMEPLYCKGDYIAGNQRYGKAIDELVGKNCIVETKTGDKYVRFLRQGSKPNVYHLFCINQNTQVKFPVLYDVSLLSAAPVIWYRKKDNFDPTI